MIRLAAALAALLVGACAAPLDAPAPYRMTFAPSAWTPAQAAALHEAAALWDEATIAGVELVEVPAGAGVSIAPGDLPTHLGGHEQHGGVTIRANLPIAEFSEVAAHEIGHALGLEPVRDGVMQGDARMHGLQLSAEDIAECERVGACAPKE